MKRFSSVSLIFLLSLMLSKSVFAETIELKSGKKITGKVIERTANGIKLQVGTGIIKLMNDDIADSNSEESHHITVISVPVPSKFTLTAEHGSLSPVKKAVIRNAESATQKVKLADNQADGPTQNAEPDLKIIPTHRQNLLQQPVISLTDAQKKQLMEATKKMLGSFGVKMDDPKALQEKIQTILLKLRIALERIQKNKNEIMNTTLLLLTFIFLFSVLILTLSIKLAGGDTSYLKALVFESKWLGVRTIFVISIFVISFLLEFLFSHLITGLGADAAILGGVSSVVKVVLILASPILLFFLFVKVASKNFLLNTGQVVAVIVISIFLKFIFTLIIWVGLGPSIMNFLGSYFS